MDVDVNSHISLTSNDDIRKICNGFFSGKKININHINYFHKDKSGSVYYLCSNHDWIKHYIESGYTHIGAFETKQYLSNERYVLWDSLDSDDIILKDSKELINVEHGLTVVQKEKDGISFFNFGNNNGDINNLNQYINNLMHLNEFIPYFLAKAKNIIKDANNQRIIVTPKYAPINKEQDVILKERLSQREMECVYWYLKGKSSGEIAIILEISRRTVETHIENIKLKLDCSNLFQLGYRIAAMRFFAEGYIPNL